MTASTPPPQAYSTRPLTSFRLLWRFRCVRRHRGRHSFALRVGCLSWRVRWSRFRSRGNASSSVTPGSVSGLFDEPLLDSVAAQVKEDSLVSSSLAVSKALSSRSGSKPLAMYSSPLAGPSGYRPPRPAQRSGKLSVSSSRSGGRMRFTCGKGSAPSSTPSGFRKWEPSPCLTLSGGCLSLHWQAWRDRGADLWVVEVLREGYRFPFLRPPPLSTDPIPMPSYAPTSIKGAALEEVTLALFAKGAVELAPLPSPGFSSRLFVVWKTSGSWRPVIDLSLLIRFVDISHFRMGTIPSVLMSVRQGDWMASIDLGFCASGISSLPALCGSWLHLPFQCVVLRSAHGPAGLHSGYGSCIRCSSFLGYQYASLPGRLARPGIVPGGLLRDLGVVFSLCRKLGIVVNPD